MVIKGVTSAKVDGHMKRTQRGTPQKKKKPRPVKRRKGEEAKGRRSHMGRDSEPESLLR